MKFGIDSGNLVKITVTFGMLFIFVMFDNFRLQYTFYEDYLLDYSIVLTSSLSRSFSPSIGAACAVRSRFSDAE